MGRKVSLPGQGGLWGQPCGGAERETEARAKKGYSIQPLHGKSNPGPRSSSLGAFPPLGAAVTLFEVEPLDLDRTSSWVLIGCNSHPDPIGEEPRRPWGGAREPGAQT